MGPKRPSASNDSGDESPNKKKKRSENVEEERAGFIEKVYMKNFMCHSSMEITLNKRINFIIGRNGSGKSAILAALVIALGSKASSTNRASSLKDFIKTGAYSAMVQVTISNVGLLAYKPAEYGSKIIVVRNIYSGSTPSSYKIKSERGEVVSTKRDELQRIVTTLNIQVDNPVSVLNQDRARTFLASTDVKDKYEIFMKATRLEDVDQLHSVTMTCEANAKARLHARKSHLKQQEKEVKGLEKKVNALKKLREIQQKVVNYENEYFWAVARDEETNLADMQCQIDKEREKLQALKDVMERRKEDLQNIQEELRNMESSSSSTELKEAKNEILEAEKKRKEIQAQYQSSLLQYRQLQKEKEKYEHDSETLLQEIAKYKKAGAASMEKRQALEEAIALKQKEQDKINATLQTTDLEHHQLRGEYDHYGEQERNLNFQRREIVQTVATKNNQLRKLKTDSNNLSVYADWMPSLIQRIEECHQQNKFVRKPLGPLGFLIKVRDAKWARAIELEIGAVLRSFACHCGQDARLLRDLFKEVVRTGRNPGILVSKFRDKVHNIQEKSVKMPGYQNIFEALTISDPNVANFLIDNSSIEGILLVPTGKEAADMMCRKPPRNCRKGITLNADQYFPYPDYRMYAGNQRAKASLLQVSMQDIIRNMETEIQADQHSLTALEAKIRDVHDSIKKNNEQKKGVEQRKKDLRALKSKKTSEIGELQHALDILPDPQNLLALEGEVVVQGQKLKSIQEQEQMANEDTDQKKQALNEAKDTLQEAHKKFKDLEENVQKLQSELASLKEKVQNKGTKVKDSEVVYNSHCKKLKTTQESLKAQEEKTTKAVEEACKVCPQRMTTQRKVQDIKTDITDCKSYENMVEKENDVTPEVIDLLYEKSRKVRESQQQMVVVDRGLKVLSEALESRKELYNLIRRVMALKVLYMFKPLLKQRGYKGDMIFNHVGRTLDVQISPIQEKGSRETKSLSGGERSYSTVAFILSLWECVEAPFYFMDEFDVFMDKVNRKVILEILVMHARQNRQHQYVFLTPQDISSIVSSRDVTIHKLDDPERMKNGR